MKYLLRLVGFLAGVAFLVLVTLGALYGLRMPLDDPEQSQQSGAMSSDFGAFGPDGPVPVEATVMFQPEIDLITQPYAPGQVAPPTVGMLVPMLVNATTADPQPGDSTYLATGIGPQSETVSIVVAPGDVGVKAALYWQCGWAKEYFDAESADDADRMNTAADSLRLFPTLSPIVQFNPDLGTVNGAVVDPMLDGDDEEGGRVFFQHQCGWPESE